MAGDGTNSRRQNGASSHPAPKNEGLQHASVSRPIKTACPVSASTRPGRWGDPYDVRVFGREFSLALSRETMDGCSSPSLVKDVTDELCNTPYAAHCAFMKRSRELPAKAAGGNSGQEFLVAFAVPTMRVMRTYFWICREASMIPAQHAGAGRCAIFPEPYPPSRRSSSYPPRSFCLDAPSAMRGPSHFWRDWRPELGIFVAPAVQIPFSARRFSSML